MSEQHAASKQDKRPAQAEKTGKKAKHPARRHAKTLNNAPAQICFPSELPVSARRQEIAEAIKNNQVVVVSGETGSGKTTQLPKICLELGRGRGALIGHTQPRRIAARSVATRIAHELGEYLGKAIGFQVRFTDVISNKTMVKLMTDGILLAEIRTDPLLKRYDTIIVDEAHERSLNIDFILGYLARLLPRRPDLKVIITSATIDSQRFAEHFSRPSSPVPIIEVSGRTYPVEVRYRPLDSSDTGDEGEVGEEETPGQNRTNLSNQQKSGIARGEVKDQTEGICQAVDELFCWRVRRYFGVFGGRTRYSGHRGRPRRASRSAICARRRAYKHSGSSRNPAAICAIVPGRTATSFCPAPLSTDSARHQCGGNFANRTGY